MRRHREMFAFSAVRTTHAAGAGCLLTLRMMHRLGQRLGHELLRRVLVTDAD